MAGSHVSNNGPRAVLSNVAENTTLHGVPNAFRARSWMRKTIWSVLFLVGLGICLYQVTRNFEKYYSRPTSSTAGLVSGFELEFPAVTFCNMNPVRQSMMNLSILESISPDNNYWDNYATFQYWYSQLDPDKAYRIGHSLNHVLLDCEFAGNDCTNRSYFSYIFNGQYGNCYTFNGGNMTKRLDVSNVGPRGGLMLELYIEQNEYLPILSDVAGIRLVIHNQTYMPLPEKEGIVLATGLASGIAITRLEVRRDKFPYGQCAEVDSKGNEDINAYTSVLEYVEYSYQACRFTCYQRHVIEECACGDPWYPMQAKAFPVLNGNIAKPCLSQDETNCMAIHLDKFYKGLDGCMSPHCPMMCLEISYDKVFSFGRWPSKTSKDQLFAKMNKTIGDDGLFEAFDGVKTDSDVDAWIQQNVVKVLVYFETLDYNTFTTVGSYSVINLLSDQGGQVSLWLGLSVLTLFEMVELLWDLAVSLLTKKKSTKSEPDE